ncbi:MAG: hypothetical protein K9K33_07460 [Desulfarculaceae bacterium]|nr:hypothetical protein [Desulfarculaceae bacterium]
MATQLAGANLTNAVLPETVAKFPVIESSRQAASYARRLFTPLFISCALLLMINGLSEVGKEFLEFSIMGFKTKIPTHLLPMALPLIILLWYVYLLHYLSKLWETLATLPARFPDGTPLTRHPDPWFLLRYIQPTIKWLKNNPGNTAAYAARGLTWFSVPLLLAISAICSARFGDPCLIIFNSFIAIVALVYAVWNMVNSNKILSVLDSEERSTRKQSEVD